MKRKERRRKWGDMDPEDQVSTGKLLMLAIAIAAVALVILENVMR